MPIALRCFASSAVGPKANRSSMCRICRSETRSAATAGRNEAESRRTSKIVIPAKAGFHRADARAAEKWVPAFAGTADLGEQGVIERASGCTFWFYTATLGGHPRVNVVVLACGGN